MQQIRSADSAAVEVGETDEDQLDSDALAALLSQNEILDDGARSGVCVQFLKGDRDYPLTEVYRYAFSPSPPSLSCPVTH